MLLKVSAEQLALVGAATAEEFPAKLSEKVKSMGDVSADISALTQTVNTLAKTVGDLQSTVSKCPTESRVTELVTAGVTSSMNAWASSPEGEKLIGAKASKIAMDALGSVGTVPVKAAPLAPEQTLVSQAETLLAGGKFEEAFPMLKRDKQAEFADSPKVYAAFMRHSHQTRISGNPDAWNAVDRN